MYITQTQEFFSIITAVLAFTDSCTVHVATWVCLMCEPASHASHVSQSASHASHAASHAIHASQGAKGASHASYRFNVKNNQIRDYHHLSIIYSEYRPNNIQRHCTAIRTAENLLAVKVAG